MVWYDPRTWGRRQEADDYRKVLEDIRWLHWEHPDESEEVLLMMAQGDALYVLEKYGYSGQGDKDG